MTVTPVWADASLIMRRIKLHTSVPRAHARRRAAPGRRDVRRRRAAAGLTQAELAAKMGVDRAYVSALELGGRNPTIVILWHLARASGR